MVLVVCFRPLHILKRQNRANMENNILEDVQQQIYNLQKKVELYFELLQCKNELDFVVKGSYLVKKKRYFNNTFFILLSRSSIQFGKGNIFNFRIFNK